eukprot:2249787-Pyramimonas_sp.AAC.1
MVFPPKGDDPADRGPLVSRAPGATRPLSLSSADAKIWFGSFCVVLNDVAPRAAMGRQRGG